MEHSEIIIQMQDRVLQLQKDYHCAIVIKVEWVDPLPRGQIKEQVLFPRIMSILAFRRIFRSWRCQNDSSICLG